MWTTFCVVGEGLRWMRGSDLPRQASVTDSECLRAPPTRYTRTPIFALSPPTPHPNMSQADYFPSEDATAFSTPGHHRLPAAEVQNLGANAEPPKTVRLPISDAIVRRTERDVNLSDHLYYNTLEEYGYVGVIDTAYQVSQDALHPYHNGKDYKGFKSLAAWRSIGAGLLGDIPLSLLQALLDGTLDAKVKSEDSEDEVATEVKKYFTDGSSYWKMRQQGAFAPVHYVRIFADSAGNSPSHRQLSLVLSSLRKYVSGDPRYDQVCADIDNTTRTNRTDAAAIRKGHHHFFNGSISRVRHLHTFIAAQQAYLDTIAPEAQDKPIPDPLQYVGFTTNIARRASEHADGESSWLMTLFSAVCRRLFQRPDRIPMFEFETFVVAFPINRDECHLGEELLCRLCKSYYYNGTGFNIQAGGMSEVAPKLEELPESGARALWHDRLMFRNESPVFEKQVVDDIENYKPRWDVYLRYLKMGYEAYEQDLIAKVDQDIAGVKDRNRSKEDVLARIATIESQNLHEEAKVECADTRAALATVNRQRVQRLMAELDTAVDVPSQ
jgi:hypothetical protein